LKILEENSYYPFGMKHATYSNNDQPNYKYKYNGKEYQDELGLNLTAMDFRQYDNTLGRFNVIDPLAEQDYGITPYHFGYNNPVLFGDPSGLKAQAPEGTENNIVPGSVLAMFASGMNGLQVRDALEQQAWGPNFIIIHAGGGGGSSGGGGGSSGGNGVGGDRYDGAGGIGLVDIKPLGHWKKDTEVSVSGHIVYDSNGNIRGWAPDEISIKAIKVWVWDLTIGDVFSNIKNAILTDKGMHHGVHEYESIIAFGGAFTPGNFVVYPIGGSKKKYFNTHEPGHVLQYRHLGFIDYYRKIAIPSLLYAMSHSPEDASHYWTETSANRLWWLETGESDELNNPFK
jgi:RHS repeat-associated protein